MHKHIQSLSNISVKPERYIIGLMSGTSLDGLDVALCRFSGQGLATSVSLLQFETVNYSADYKNRVKAVFARREIDLQHLTLLHPWIGLEHGRIVNACLAKWGLKNTDVDIIASHGQTVYHCPQRQHLLPDYGNATLQLGDGDHLAVSTGIITISDFRQKHIAAGGEGAPLAVYGDYLIFSSDKENRVMLNMGGIANFTFLPQSRDVQQIFSSDIGPGNTLMDAYIQAHFPGQFYDNQAAVARAGTISQPLLQQLKQHDFFQLAFPKTTGPEVFNLAYLQQAQQHSQTSHLDHQDVMATLNKFSADMIVAAIRQLDLPDAVLYASGGGIHNPLLMQHIRSALPELTVKTTAQLGIEPDAKEAVLFAVLANECLVGNDKQLGNAREGIPDVTMGKISFPD